MRESEKARALRRPPGSLDVYDLTQRGLAEKHKLDRDSLIAARADLERAVTLNSGYAPAQLFLAQVDLLDIGSGGHHRPVRRGRPSGRRGADAARGRARAGRVRGVPGS